MCLGIPGKVLERFQRDALPMGRVSFGGVVKETCLAYTPEVQVGDYVLVHVGFALSRIDEQEAQEMFAYLEAISTAEGKADAEGDRPLFRSPGAKDAQVPPDRKRRQSPDEPAPTTDRP
jgi:hydrogenase expression/formation protein HypC